MHERTQRAMARLMFVLCCAMPTMLTASAILFTKTSWYHRRCLAEIESTLSDETGLVIRVSDFERATPSSLQLSGLSLLDPETEGEIARVHRVNWARRHDEIVFVLHQPELQSAKLRHVWMMLHDRFLCRPGQTQVPVHVIANDLTIHSRNGPLTLRDVNALVTPQARRTLANIVATPADGFSGTPIKVRIKRDRRDVKPTTSWTLDSGGTALPCSALAEYLPLMNRLGAEATYTGVMTYDEQADGGATLDLGASQFSGIELSRLFEDLPHKMTGTADLKLYRCLIGPDGKGVDVSGQLDARSGLVGGTLLASLSQNLSLAVPERWASTPVRELGYDRIAVGFNLRDELLTLKGNCNADRMSEYLPAGTMLSAGGEPLVLTSEESVPAVQLARALAPSHSVLVPVSEQTSPLLEFFRAPSRPREFESGSSPQIISAAPSSGGPAIRQRF